jgi:hypothetical protein
VVLVIADALRYEVDAPRRMRRHLSGETRRVAIDLRPELRRGARILPLHCGRVLELRFELAEQKGETLSERSLTVEHEMRLKKLEAAG